MMSSLKLLHHRYKFGWLNMFTGYMSWLVIFGILVFVIYYPLHVIIGERSSFSPGGLLVLFLTAAFGFSCLFLRAEFYPEIDSDENGLRVSFLWSKLQVGWEQITGYYPLFHLGIIKIFVLRTKALTPLHYLYGLVYGLTIAPCTIISPALSNFGELEKRIKSAISINQFIRQSDSFR